MDENLKILVLEDDPGLNELIKRRLSREGHQCFGFKKAEEALEWLSSNSADMLILDLMLPGCSGEELISILKNNNIDIPFIVATGQGSEATAVKLLKKGARDYLVKNSDFLNVLPAAVEMVWREIQLEHLLKKAREQISVKNATLSAVFEFSPQGILVIGPDDEIDSYNRNLTEVLHIEKMPSNGREFFDIVAAKAENPKFFTEKTIPHDPELKGLVIDEIKIGDLFFEIYTSPLLAQQEFGGRVWYFRDITLHKNAREAVRKAKEDAEKNAEMRSRFFALVSHDIKTPFTSIQGFIKLLYKTELTEKQKEYLDIIASSGEHMITLLSDILDLTRLEQGEVEFNIQKFSLYDTLKSSINSFLPKVDDKNISLSFEIAHGTPEIIEGDLHKVKQIVMNLVGNAVKFTKEGSVTLRCREKDENFVEISVSDTGIGMDEGTLQRIFTPFSQGNGSISSEFGGYGLGLAIAANLVGRFGGKIWAESTAGEGSVFSFTLPRYFNQAQPGLINQSEAH
ncbi:MAG: hypothetical protein A2020_15965 [Lentisphaerae bacterium GWF2_45_14]|nr:MAG: hypothetical protein A2020_15965 [Lentisphaerae bacterium GWF2_45_14]